MANRLFFIDRNAIMIEKPALRMLNAEKKECYVLAKHGNIQVWVDCVDEVIEKVSSKEDGSVVVKSEATSMPLSGDQANSLLSMTFSLHDMVLV